MKRLYTPEQKDQIFYEIKEAQETIRRIKSKPYRTPEEQNILDIAIQTLRTLRSM